MKFIVAVMLCVAVTQAHPPPPPPHPAGVAVSNQQSKAHAGDDSTVIAQGDSNAEGGPGGAISNQKSGASAGDGGTAIADGQSQASAHHGDRVGDLMNKFGIHGGGGPGKFGHRHGPGGLSGGNSVSNQESKVHVGADGTGIASGDSSAEGHNAISNQLSQAKGGPGATVIATGTSSSIATRKRSIDSDTILDTGIYAAPGGVRVSKRMHHQQGQGAAVANQESKVQGGRGGGNTGIADGDATALGGKGGALANQKSVATSGGGGNTMIAHGSASASTLPQQRNRRSPPAAIADQTSLAKTGPHGTAGADGSAIAKNRKHGLAIANQNSISKAGPHGSAESTGLAAATSKGGSAHAKQDSVSQAGVGGSAYSGGTATANADYKRDLTGIVSDPLKSTSALISDVVAKTTGDAAKKIVLSPDTLLASSSVTTKNN